MSRHRHDLRYRTGARASAGIIVVTTLAVLAGCRASHSDLPTSQPDTQNACPDSRLDCDAPCETAEECQDLGGYACLSLAERGLNREPDAAVKPTPSLRDAAADEDAGTDDEDGGARAVRRSDAPPQPSRPGMTATRMDSLASEGAEPVDAGERTYCTRECDSKLCVDPNHVCSSRTGICKPGCDETRPTCSADRVCDRTLKRCVLRDGRCDSVVDCGIFDSRLLERGQRDCSQQWCRFIPATKSKLNLIKSPRASGLTVEQPAEGLRIDMAELDAFVFRFATPGQTSIAAILTRPHRSVRDASKAAIWAAFVPSDEAAEGVSLARGGRMRNGEWSATPAEIRPNTQYYFLALALTRGEVVAQSDLVPFTVGAPYARVGDSCAEENGQFCASDEVLICASGTCKTPCLSDLDCDREGLPCGPPGWRGVRARLCL